MIQIDLNMSNLGFIDKLVKAPAPAAYELVLAFALYTHHHPNLLSCFSAPCGQIRASELELVIAGAQAGYLFSCMLSLY